MLNRLPAKSGLFLGLTGAQIGAADALFAGMADYHVLREQWPRLQELLLKQDWAPQGTLSRLANDRLLDQTLAGLSSEPVLAVGPLQQHLSLIRQCCSGSDLQRIVAAILALADHADPWLQRAAKTLAAGSPGSARLTFTLLNRVKHVSLAEAYRIEWVAGLMCASHGDFAEGIRALLIDKDKQPKWNPSSLEDATQAWVEKFFTLPFTAERHPLYSLGR